MPEKIPELESDLVEWRSFVVDETPHAMWGFRLAEQNADFLAGIDPAFFNASAELHIPMLEGPSRQHAALAIRTTYAHALETFFVLLMAAVQAPTCPLGWALRYRPGDLPKLVRKILQGTPIYAATRFSNSWLGLVQAIVPLTGLDADKATRIHAMFADAWFRLAYDLADKSASHEYNSIKHGLRATPGGFSLSIGSLEQPNAPSISGTSDFGTRFFEPLKLHGDSVNFFAKEAARNWSPIALAIRIEILAVSIRNVISFLRPRIGIPTETVTIIWPDDPDAVSRAWISDSPFVSMAFGEDVSIAKSDLRGAADVFSAYGDRISTAPDPL